MKTACILVRGTSHQPHWGGLFAEGLRRHGWDANASTVARPADLLVCWGVRREAEMAVQRRRGGDI